MLTWLQLGIHRKPVALLDVDGYWRGLRQLLDDAVAGGFVEAARAAMLLARHGRRGVARSHGRLDAARAAAHLADAGGGVSGQRSAEATGFVSMTVRRALGPGFARGEHDPPARDRRRALHQQPRRADRSGCSRSPGRRADLRPPSTVAPLPSPSATSRAVRWSRTGGERDGVEPHQHHLARHVAVVVGAREDARVAAGEVLVDPRRGRPPSSAAGRRRRAGSPAGRSNPRRSSRGPGARARAAPAGRAGSARSAASPSVWSEPRGAGKPCRRTPSL